MVTATGPTMQQEERDHAWMRSALALAARGRGQTSPNPLVGSVIVDNGVRVGAGYHRRAGEPHAEVHALAEAGSRARGSTLYCTLEPCCHTGRTGPCAVAIVDAGIRRVVAAIQDPNPLVAGRGLAYLRDHGVEVACGVCEREAAALNRPFVVAVTLGRPHVTLKAATSIDGAVAAAPGLRTALTSAAANRRSHAFRAEVDAIAVGSGTVLSDDPELTARGVYRARPLVRLLFDRRLRTPATARVLRTVEQGPIVIFTTGETMSSDPAKAAALSAAGAEIVPVPDLVSAFRELGRREVRSVLLEGGPTLQRACWDAGVVDRVQVYVTPHVLGPAGVKWDMPASLSLAALLARRAEPLGPDVLIEGDVHRSH